jgi:hypothetical protein
MNTTNGQTPKNRTFFPKDVLDNIDNDHGMDWDEQSREHLLFQFIADNCDPQAFADYIDGQARAEQEEMTADEDGETVTLRFKPQAWVNDYGIDADPEGPTEYEVPKEDLLAAFTCLAEWGDEHETRDGFRSHRNAPKWVRNWSGPFEVELADFNADPWER